MYTNHSSFSTNVCTPLNSQYLYIYISMFVVSKEYKNCILASLNSNSKEKKSVKTLNTLEFKKQKSKTKKSNEISNVNDTVKGKSHIYPHADCL